MTEFLQSAPLHTETPANTTAIPPHHRRPDTRIPSRTKPVLGSPGPRAQGGRIHKCETTTNSQTRRCFEILYSPRKFLFGPDGRSTPCAGYSFFWPETLLPTVQTGAACPVSQGLQHPRQGLTRTPSSMRGCAGYERTASGPEEESAVSPALPVDTRMALSSSVPAFTGPAPNYCRYRIRSHVI